MARKTRKQIKTQTYTLEQELSKDMWFVKFAFDATSEKDAMGKAFDWVHYHSFNRRTIRVRLATADEKEHRLHNEYIH